MHHVCAVLDQNHSIHLQIVKSPTSTVYSSKIQSLIAPQPRRVSPNIYKLHESTMSPYMLVKTRSFCCPSFERSYGSKSAYFTQFANIVYIQRLIPPHSRGMSPDTYILHESTMCPLHAGENQESVSFVIRVQQRIKLDLLHSVNKNRPISTPYSSKTNAGVTPTNAA